MDLDSQQRAAAEQFSKQAEHYGRTHILADTSDVEVLLAKIPEKNGRALDVATGGGHCALALARAGYRMTLGDVSAVMVEKAAGLLAEEGFTAETGVFPAEDLPFADGSFALVASRVAPHHFSDPGKFVAESTRVLEPGGWFLVIDGSVPDDDAETEKWINEVEKWRDASHARLLSRGAWIELVEAGGLAVVWHSLTPFSQPDLEWYFLAAATPESSREKVRELIRTASPHVRAAMHLDESGPVTWQWQRVALLARKD